MAGELRIGWSARRYRAAPRTPSRWRRVLDVLLALAILGLLSLIAARLDEVETHRLAGEPRIHDGDSIAIDGKRIRLRGIDAPELSQSCNRAGADYPCGRLARDALVGLIGGRPVACTGWQRDRYGRLLGDCSVGGIDINRSQVESGWAVAFGDFEAEEAAARERGAGVWQGDFERPREWRKRHGDVAEIPHDALGRIAGWLRQILRLL
jgi:endonuclease YncB( thermonuclease family)